MNAPDRFLRHRLLDEWNVVHGFGLRNAPEPEAIIRPVQVHGRDVAVVDEKGVAQPPEADALLATRPDLKVAVVTADCVPILAAAEGGEEVVAIHAGWKGLASGVVGAGVNALRAASGSEVSLRAVMGPHIGPCCYEVDAPVLDALRQNFGDDLATAIQPTQSDHAMLNLAMLVAMELKSHGVRPEHQGAIQDACTRCDAERFYSYRRDGARAGRLLHFIETVRSTH